MTNEYDPHGACLTHCCVRHGCKYRLEDCPVFTRKILQAYACEDCEDFLAPVTQHELACTSEEFEAISQGRQKHDVLSTAGRLLSLGDLLVYLEYDKQTRKYTGLEVRRVICHVTPPGTKGLPLDACVVSLV